MDEHPQLTSFGVGVFDGRRKSAADRDVELANGRAALIEREAHVMTIAAWLSANIQLINTPSAGSYHVKHVVERAINGYVTNGELIAAALIAGYTFRYTDGPNVDFGMSKRDIDRADRRG
jgi:hypothetical protein